MLLAAIALASVPLCIKMRWFLLWLLSLRNRYRNGLAALNYLITSATFKRSGGSDIDVWDCQIPRGGWGPPVFGAVGFGQRGYSWSGVVTRRLPRYLLIDSKMLASKKPVRPKS